MRVGRFLPLVVLASCGPRSQAPTVIVAATSAPSSSASLPAAVTRPTLLSMGARSCALRSSGDVLCWGDAPGGIPAVARRVEAERATGVSFMNRELVIRTQQGTSLTGPFPGNQGLAAAPQLDRLESLSCRSNTCCGVERGVVSCWGSNAGSRLGREGPSRPTREPVPAVPPAVSVVVGAEHACALLRTGQVYCWGSNHNGQLGDPSSMDQSKPEGTLVQWLHDVVQIATDFRFTCALMQDGDVRCWGDAISGSLGGNSARSGTPVGVRDSPGARQIAVSYSHGCLLAKDHTVWCWGANDYGQVGNGTKTRAPAAVKVSGLDDAIAVAAGDSFSCAMKRDESVMCWGKRLDGRLGDGATSQMWTPTVVPGAGPAIGLCEDTLGACAVGADHRMRCWGYLSLPKPNDKTDVAACTANCVLHGNGRVECETPVKGLDQTVALTGAGQSGCALRRDGAVLCWDSGGERAKTVFRNATAIAQGYRAGCALTPAQELWCWGDVTRHGFAGAKPIVPEGGRGVAALSMDTDIDLSSACVAYADGTVACWYWDLTVMQEGRLNLRLKQRPGISNAASVVGGAEHGCAILRDGRLQCWGSNDAGQLGDGTNEPRKEAVIVQGLTDVIAVHDAHEYRCALRRSGEVLCWGDNASGRLGLPIEKDARKPVPVLGIQPRGTDHQRSATRSPR